jgi:hypothetical protein
MEGPTIIERAFELAPEYGSIADVKRKLIDEGYLQVNAHLSGRQIRAEIVGRLNPELKPKR